MEKYKNGREDEEEVLERERTVEPKKRRRTENKSLSLKIKGDTGRGKEGKDGEKGEGMHEKKEK